MMVSRISLFILCILEVNRMIRGYPNQLQAIERTITFQSLEKSGLVREITSVDRENKNSSEDVGDRVADKLVDSKNNQPSEQLIGNSRQTARNRLNQFHYRGNNNNNNNSSDNIKNKSHNYPNELISFFNKENFKHWNNRDNKRKDLGPQKVVLPEELTFSIFNQTKTQNNRFVPVMPPECIGDTLCNYAPNYPTDVVREVIKKKSYLKRFASDRKPTMLAQRIISVRNKASYNLCDSSKAWYFPEMGTTINGENKYILQSPDLYQWFEAEVCNEERLPCQILPIETKNINTVCVQKWMTHPFACLSHIGEGERDWFNIKTNCCCYLD
ncbi:GSCOCG00000560001-RA-CDS [Cotesia congregata]|nr:GSCOCG00000560001-RA-CDS [Cotesia congregata]